MSRSKTSRRSRSSIRPTTTINESDVEQVALGWVQGLGWRVAQGPDIASERADYGAVVLERRRGRLPPGSTRELPAEALEDVFRRLTRPEGPTLQPRLPPDAGGAPVTDEQGRGKKGNIPLPLTERQIFRKLGFEKGGQIVKPRSERW